MSGGDVRNVSEGDIQMVQTLIEQCLPYYMTQKQVIDILYQQERVEPSFTELVWQRLEEQNQEFFKGYHLRLMVKEQIMEFNKLLDKQATLMRQLGPSEVDFRPNSNGSSTPQMHQNASYAPSETGIAMKTENMQHSASSNFSRGFNANVPPSMLLAAGGTNGVAVKTEANYPRNSRSMYGTDASVSSFSCLEPDPHQTLLNDSSLFSLLDPMPQNFGLTDSTADFSNNTLEGFSRSGFLPSERDNFLDSHSSTVEHQGENKRLDMPENLGFEDFGSNS